jgi:hypothetical protein
MSPHTGGRRDNYPATRERFAHSGGIDEEAEKGEEAGTEATSRTGSRTL